MKLYVGNIKWTINDDQLKSTFSSTGNVVSASVVLDRETGRSRGFGFVEMASDEEGNKAIQLLNGKDIDGRALIVSEARPEGNKVDRIATDLAVQIGAFCKGAMAGNNYGFKIGERHFTITCDL
jgi:RNA recognition motif-containing protein